MSDIDERLDKILSNYKRSQHEAYINDTPKMSFVADERLEHQLYSLLMDIIGEDGSHTPEAEAHMDNPEYKYACCERTQSSNSTKAEQRQKLNQLFNKDK